MIEAALMCLALNVYFEARSDTMTGQYAVAQTVINRVQHDKFPDDVCSVVKQSRSNGTCQFSWYCDGKHDEPPTRGSMWKESQEIAEYVLTTPDLKDITDGATHYHADYISSPRWAEPRRKTVEIDTHIFYNKSRKDIKKT